jgi:hypothetical protein
MWSEWGESNSRVLAPEASALPLGNTPMMLRLAAVRLEPKVDGALGNPQGLRDLSHRETLRVKFLDPPHEALQLLVGEDLEVSSGHRAFYTGTTALVRAEGIEPSFTASKAACPPRVTRMSWGAGNRTPIQGTKNLGPTVRRRPIETETLARVEGIEPSSTASETACPPWYTRMKRSRRGGSNSNAQALMRRRFSP